MTILAQELLLRVRDLEIEALAALTSPVTCDAVEYFYHVQEDFPYWTNRISGIAVTGDSEEFDFDTYEVTMRLIVGHITEGYVGDPESTLYLYIPHVKLFFNEREHLQTTSGDYDTAMIGLWNARIGNSPGLRIFTDAGISAQQVGTEFVLTCEFEEEITQVFN